MIEIIPNFHPIFVHFTVALLSVSLGLFIVNIFFKCEQAVIVAKWNLWIGSGISLLTLAAGIYAYNTVAHDTPSHEAMTLHRNIALITLALLIPVVIISVKSHLKGKTLGNGFIALFLVVGMLLGGTAWLGGEVVYRYGVGVMSLPKTDSHDHANHAHDDGGHSDASHSGSHSHGDSLDDMDMGDMSMDEHEDNGSGHDDGHDHAL